MGLVESRTGSGLILREEAGDAAAISRALRKMDPELRLQPEFSQTLEQTVWKVYRYNGDRPMQFVLAFTNERGEPYPLSSRLIDMVAGQDKNSRHATVDEDERNAKQREQRDRDWAREQEALKDDVLTVAGAGHSGVLHRSPGLVAARRRQRRKGWIA